ncbi:MAG TPA: hypothetical protein VMR70_01445, partial [Flavisolibacter sp.]|nr:hypothetical protein [Flavisolibacter sp.]
FGVTAYNLGINGHNFYMEYLRHKLLMKYNPPPKLIILSVDNVMLDKRENLYDKEQFAPYFSEEEVVAATKTYEEGFTSFDYLLPFVRYLPLKKPVSHLKAGTLSSTGSSPWYKGFHPHEGGWNSDFEIAVSKRKKYVQRFHPPTIRLFEQFLKETQKANIPVLFVYTPEYIEGQKFVSNREDVFANFYHFSTKYNIPFLDYTNDTLCLSKKYFFNSQHLNELGADIFIKKLVKDIRPIIAGKLPVPQTQADK